MALTESIVAGVIMLVIGAYMALLTKRVDCKVDKDLFDATNKAVDKELEERRISFEKMDKKQDYMLTTLHNLDTTTQLIRQTLDKMEKGFTRNEEEK